MVNSWVKFCDGRKTRISLDATHFCRIDNDRIASPICDGKFLFQGKIRYDRTSCHVWIDLQSCFIRVSCKYCALYGFKQIWLLCTLWELNTKDKHIRTIGIQLHQSSPI